jgi:epoxyqueuosine reductase QueG
MGLLITPEQGARVRLAAVTTDLPLLVEGPASFNLVEFCKQCTKCAEACPAGAISKKDLAPGQSAAAWKIDAQACYAFFQKSGVLCGRCLTVCPHSHPNSWPHQAARWFARRTRFARRCLLLLDDYLYGKAPSRMAEPRWLPDSSRPQ